MHRFLELGVFRTMSSAVTAPCDSGVLAAAAPHQAAHASALLAATVLGSSVALAISVAPLTTTVMAAVDADHVGAASGVNNAIARVAALFATALVGVVLVSDATPELFVAQFRIAAWVAVALAAAAGASAFALLANRGAARSIDER